MTTPVTTSGFFNGGSYLSAANFTGNPAAFSVSCWVNLLTSQVSRIFFSDYTGWAVGISDSSNNQTKFFLGSATLTGPTALTPGRWHHAVFTHDGTTAKIYLNGNAAPDASAVAALTYGSVPANNYIGSLNGSIQGLLGSLAAVGYWSRALSAAEAVSLYAAGQGLYYAGLSGTLLTSLAAYYDFPTAAGVGADSAGAHGMTGAGLPAWAPDGPGGTPYVFAGPYSRPTRPAVSPPWGRGLRAAVTLCNEAGSATGLYDPALGSKRPFLITPPQWNRGPWGTHVTFNDSFAGGVDCGLPVPGGAAECTLSALCTRDGSAAAVTNRSLWGQSGVGMRMVLSSNLMQFQMGHDGAFPNAVSPPPASNSPVLVTVRMTAAGVRSIWYGPYKVAERTDAGVAWGSVSGNLGLGKEAGQWAGNVYAGYVWARALTDSEIVALAADPFAPVRPAPARVGLLAPPSPTFDPVPWLRAAAAGPHAARLPLPPVSGWAPGLAASPDLLPWLGRAAAPAPPVPAPRARLAPWTPASAPAPDPLAWLLRGPSAPAPGAPPPAAPQAGWRPDVAAGPAPPVRHALVRFWRGPEARMPRLEDGEPAWATDTKSLWMGSAAGNVRIGP